MRPDNTPLYFDDRRAAGDSLAPSGVLADKPPVLRRWTINLFAVLGILAILYGTLAPFRIDAARSFTGRLTSDPLVSGDAVANVLIYVPIGIFLRLLVRRRGSRWLSECLLSLLAAAGLSYLTEVCQTILACRVPSWVDWYCNVIGAAIGLAIAPLFQRLLRRRHTWFYHEVRVRPFSAAAAGTIILVGAAALMPFDIQPTPSHVGRALHRLHGTSLSLPWTIPGAPASPLEPVQVFDKMTAAGSFGLVTFLLTVARMEVGRRRLPAVWFAATRTFTLVAAIELLQLFTVTHAADPRDLLMGWLFTSLGALVAWAMLARSEAIPPPLTVLRGLVMVIALGVAGRAAVAAAFIESGPASAMASWLPMASSFNRPWHTLLGDYLATFLQYALLAGLLVLWSRAGRRRPNGLFIGVLVVLAGIAGEAFSRLAGRPTDAAAVLLALLAAWVTIRLDRAVFGRLTSPPNAGISGQQSSESPPDRVTADRLSRT